MLDWLRSVLGESRQIVDLRIQVTTLTAQSQTSFQEALTLREKLSKLEEARLAEVKMMANWTVNQSGSPALFQDVPHTDPAPAPPAEAIYRQSGRERQKRELFDAVTNPMTNGFDLGANHPVALRYERDRRAAEKESTEKPGPSGETVTAAPANSSAAMRYPAQAAAAEDGSLSLKMDAATAKKLADATRSGLQR